MRPVFRAGGGECRDHAVRNQVKESRERERTRSLIGNDGIGIVSRQDADRPGQSDEPDCHQRFGYPGVDLNLGDFRRQIRGPGGAGEAGSPGRIGPASEKGQDPHSRVEAEALRLVLEAAHWRLAAPGGTGSGHSRTWLPARAGQLAATPGRPRRTASVRTNEFTVACSARKRSSTDARTYSPPVVHAWSSNVNVTSRPRQKPPLRAPGPRKPGMRAVPGLDVTVSRARIAVRDSVDSRQS